MADPAIRVSFYVMEGEEPGARLGYACRLVEKVWKLGQRIHVAADDSATVQTLDELLWTFRQGSFVPHEILTAGRATEAPITLALTSATPPVADVLVNLGSEVPGYYQQFPRIAEIVDSSDAGRSAGRDRHRFYKEHGIEPETHKVG